MATQKWKHCIIALYQKKKKKGKTQYLTAKINHDKCLSADNNQPVTVCQYMLKFIFTPHVAQLTFPPKQSKFASLRKSNRWHPFSHQHLISDVHRAAFYSCSLFVWCHAHADRHRLDVSASLLFGGGSAPWTAPLQTSVTKENVGGRGGL